MKAARYHGLRCPPFSGIFTGRTALGKPAVARVEPRLRTATRVTNSSDRANQARDCERNPRSLEDRSDRFEKKADCLAAPTHAGVNLESVPERTPTRPRPRRRGGAISTSAPATLSAHSPPGIGKPRGATPPVTQSFQLVRRRNAAPPVRRAPKLGQRTDPSSTAKKGLFT